MENEKAPKHTCGSILLPEAVAEAMRNCTACQTEKAKDLEAKKKIGEKLNP